MSHLKNKTKLLILEFIESNPFFPHEEIHNYFGISKGIIKGLFNKGYILIPSKINKNVKRKKVYRRERLLPGKRESDIHKGVSTEKKKMLHRKM